MAQAESSKPVARHAVPWLDPLSRYFHVLPAAIGSSVVCVLTVPLGTERLPAWSMVWTE